MLPLLLFFVFATSASARTIKLDNGIGYIMVGENAECVNMPPPVYGSPRICLGPTSNLLIGPLNISQRLDDTIVFSVLGSFAVAVNVDGAISVGQSLVFGGPNSVSVTPQNMHKLYDGIWSVENQVNVVNGLVQTVSLPDSNIGGMRVKSTLSNASVVILYTGQVVADNGISRDLVIGGVKSNATVITRGSVFAPGRRDVPVVTTVPIPVDGSIQLTLVTFSSPSVCGNALARQTVETVVSTAVCTALTSNVKTILTNAGQPVTDDHVGIVFSQCPDPSLNSGEHVFVNATVYTDVLCTADASAISVVLGECIENSALFKCVHAK